ncbi:MAG: glycosyltransferase [Armatimonadota bacterium]|nr:glycosyltransferase [Armatimonadota bacterium]MDR7438939.1 glycosyltransferase [Armatimonadota bacterium]MDR7563246.1 glycosyltransferase [Armatimonadota bacterium]MDR7601350.1 glycosyltransferase [Armatimonadota bacterium]
MNVLLLTNEYPHEKTAGTAMATAFLAEELASRGVRVTVVVNTRTQAPAHEVTSGLEVIRLKPLPVFTTRMAQRAAMLLRIARRIRPDVIQGQSLSCGALAALAGKLLGIPSVTYVQGLDLYEASPWARRTYIRWALRGSTAVAAVTEDLRRRAHGLVNRPVEVIPHGLRLRDSHRLGREEARRSLGLPEQDPVVLYVGRLLRIKGPQHLLRAFPQVLERLPRALLVLVGEGEERANLEVLVRRLGVEGRVRFAGPRPHEDVIRFMRASDVFVLPSLVESFGIVLLEAMSCGLPVVATNVMGIPYLVEDGENGFLVPPGDEVALATCITALLRDPWLCRSFGERNIRKASDYLVSHIADRFVALWHSLVPPARKEVP